MKKRYPGRQKSEKYLIFFKKEVKFFGNCRNLYGNLAVTWTIKSQEQLDEMRKYFDMFIFDSFVPDADYMKTAYDMDFTTIVTNIHNIIELNMITNKAHVVKQILNNPRYELRD